MNNFSPEEKFVETGNGKVAYYLDKPFPDGPVVVFIHGLSSNHTTWLNIMKIIREQGYNSLAVDLRGHGYSDKRKIKALYTFPVFTDDLDKIIKAEKIVRFFLVGYSFGGYVSIDYAIKHKDSVLGLVLISTNYVNPLVYKKINFLTPISYAFVNLLAFLLLWQKRKKYYYYKHGESKGYWHSTMSGLITMPISINLWMLCQIGKVDFRGSIGNIKAPTLMVRSHEDPFLSETEVQDMIRVMPRAETVMSKHNSHYIAADSQEETAQIILDFIKKCE